MALALNQFFSANPVDESDDSPMITAVNYNLARSSSRLGHGPLKAGARVRVPYALPSKWFILNVLQKIVRLSTPYQRFPSSFGDKSSVFLAVDKRSSPF
jgi:hypothetical protein